MSTTTMSTAGRLAGRPARTRGIDAHPRRTPRGAVRAGVVSCTVDRRPVARVSGWMRLKVAALGAIAIVGGIVGVTGYVAALSPDPGVGAQPDAAAWAHVE